MKDERKRFAFMKSYTSFNDLSIKLSLLSNHTVCAVIRHVGPVHKHNWF